MTTQFTILRSLTILLATCIIGSVSAQESDSLPKRPVHLGLVYPLSTNGSQAAEFSNGASLHALVGVSAAEQSAALSGIGNVVKQDVYGAAIAGVFNIVGGAANGAQVAGVFNSIGRSADGAQIAGVFNRVQQSKGVAIAGISNISVQHSGLQLSGLFNTAKVSEGLQLSGLMNKAGHAHNQISGLINYARKVEGVQVAGLINIAEESDYPIGIINIVKNGEMQLGLSVDDLGSALVNFRSGGRVTYGILGLGFNMDPQTRYVLEAGVGMHFPMRRHLRLNTELTSSTLTDLSTTKYHRSSVKVLGEWFIFPGFSVYAGPSLSYLGYSSDQVEIGKSRFLWKERESAHYNGIMWGASVGVQVNL